MFVYFRLSWQILKLVPASANAFEKIHEFAITRFVQRPTPLLARLLSAFNFSYIAINKNESRFLKGNLVEWLASHYSAVRVSVSTGDSGFLRFVASLSQMNRNFAERAFASLVKLSPDQIPETAQSHFPVFTAQVCHSHVAFSPHRARAQQLAHDQCVSVFGRMKHLPYFRGLDFLAGEIAETAGPNPEIAESLRAVLEQISDVRFVAGGFLRLAVAIQSPEIALFLRDRAAELLVAKLAVAFETFTPAALGALRDGVCAAEKCFAMLEEGMGVGRPDLSGEAHKMQKLANVLEGVGDVEATNILASWLSVIDHRIAQLAE
jgi:hypothetical protein